MRAPSGFVVFALALVSLSFSSCGSHDTEPSLASALDDDAITIGSFDFPESELLARIYGEALRSGGYRVRYAIGLGPRELVEPALARGLVELIPEYAGSALQFLTRDSRIVSSDPDTNHRLLVRTLTASRIEPLEAAPAQNANAVVVSKRTATAGKNVLRDISDLRAIAPKLKFAGPPECPSRPFCLEGLEESYRLRFETFVSTDVGGPLTLQALERGQIDVAVLFTTDPNLRNGNLVELRDDRQLQPAENVTPLIRREVVRRWGPKLTRLVDHVSAKLTTEGLLTLNRKVLIGKQGPAKLAAEWVQQRGIR